MSDAPRPLPVPNSDSSNFWEGCRAGELRLQHCVACGEFQFYPRMFCVSCGGSEIEWKVSSGVGRLVSFTVIHRPPGPAFAGEEPYGIGLVELEEGVQMMGRLVDCDLEGLRCDQQVRSSFIRVTDEFDLMAFVPEGPEGE